MAKVRNVKQLRKTPTTVKLTATNGNGEQLEVDVYPLMAKDMALVRTFYNNPPMPPMVERGGVTVPNLDDAEYKKASDEYNMTRAYAMAACAVGLDVLGVDNPEEGAALMPSMFTEDELGRIMGVALGNRILQFGDVEGVAHALAPFPNPGE